MKLVDILPNYKTYILKKANFKWEEECELLNVTYVENLSKKLQAIQLEQFKSNESKKLIAFSFSLIQDIVQAKKQVDNPSEKIVLNYLQFLTTVTPLELYVKQKDMGESYNWISYSFCDNLTKDQVKEFEVIRIFEFVGSPIVNKLIKFEIMSQWIGNFYYVCRCFSAIPHVAADLMQWSIAICNESFKSGDYSEFAWALSNLTCWAANNSDYRIENLVSNIEKIVTNEAMPAQLKLDLLYCLSTIVSNFSTKKSWEWAQQALDNYSNIMTGHLKLHFLLYVGSVINQDYLNKYSELVIKEVQNVKQIEFDESETNSATLLKRADRLIDLISPFVGKCIDYHQGAFAISLIKQWYLEGAEDAIDSEELLFFYPNDMSSIKYLIGGQSYVYYRRQNEYFKKVMTEGNRFLGVSYSAGMIPDFKLNLPDRFGVPNAKYSGEFERSLVDFYALNMLQKKIKTNMANVKFIVSMPSHQHPIQYLMAKYLKYSFPIAASLKSPKPDRKIVNVCLWAGAGSITEEIELSEINSIFKSQDIKLNIFTSGNATKDLFTKIYESDEYDVIWVMSHGEFDHWTPGNSNISVSDKEFISLNEILKLTIPNNPKRRLLFLNVCDGAAFANLGGLPKIGFAPALASPSQCVLSHLWPISPWAAALFGTLLAINLTKESDYFKAYNASLINMMLENEEIYRSITEVLGEKNELIPRLNNQNLLFKEMAQAGSAAFFQ